MAALPTKTKRGSPSLKAGTKIAKVIALLKRKRGANLQDMIKVTGWQEHSVRAALTGLRKKGYTIERAIEGRTSCYRMVEANQ